MTNNLDVSQITDTLFIAAWPGGKSADEIQALEIQMILSMTFKRPGSDLRNMGIRMVWLPTSSTSPLAPIPLCVFRRGVKAALPVIEAGGKVLVHCRAGMHRSVAMACCLLISSGYAADEAMQLVKTKREAADPDAIYIQRRIRKFESYWQKKEES